MAKTALQWALWLAERGFLISPLPAGSKSAKGLKSWKETYTTDADRIRTWFELAPDMNYLVCPGADYTIVDVDTKHGIDGNAGFADLQEENFPAPTFKVRSPRGGHHHYYKTSVSTGNGHHFPEECNVDLRGEGGYVVGPGSVFEGKRYNVVDPRDPLDAPEWMLPMFKPARAKDDRVDDPLFEPDSEDALSRAAEFLRLHDPAVEGEHGNEHTYVTVQLLRDLCISKEKTMELLLAPGGWNDRCEPPWDVGELEITVDNAYRYAKHRMGSKGGGIGDRYEPDDVEVVDVSTLDLLLEEDSDPFSQLRPYLLRGEDLWKADTYQRFIIPEWIPDQGYTCVLARRGVGKSTLMIDMASCISTDMEWHGWPVLKGYYSIYFCGEHDSVALQLLRAWKDHNLGVDVADNDRFIFLRNAGDLIDTEKTIQWMKFLRQQIGPQGKAVTFLDTWQRATSSTSQNDDADMNKAAHNAEMLSAYLGGPMVVAAHPPKSDDDSVSGSALIENNSAAILTMTNQMTDKRLEVTRQKGRGEGNHMNIHFEIIDFDEKDEHGRAITGQAVTRIGGSSATGGDDSISESPDTLSVEASAEEKREAFALALILIRRHVKSEDGKKSPEICVSPAADILERVCRASEETSSAADKEIKAAGGSLVFGGPSSSKTFGNSLRDLFVEPRATAIVEHDGKDWEVGFGGKGSQKHLEIRERKDTS